MHLPSLRRFAAVAFLALSGVLVSRAHAADVNARIKGTVTDPSGAVIPNASVTAINEQTGVKVVTKTAGNGDYLFAQLPIGTYDISVSTPGFRAFLAKGIVLTIDQEYVEQVKLALGESNTVLEVSADAVQVDTTDSQLNNVVTGSQMVELPLVGRTFTTLELTLPGVQAADANGTSRGDFSVNGSQGQQSEYLINGADTNDIALNTLVLAPNLDAIDEFNLVTGPLNAEYDRNSGGIVTATIRRGANRVHGDAFEFYRDTFLNTNNFFQKSVTGAYIPVTPYHQNIFGGTIGGPVIKDKLFFFAAYQGTRSRVPGTNAGGQTNVFTNAQRGGDFSSDLVVNGGAGFSTNPIPSGVTIPGCATGQSWASCLTKGTVPTAAFNSISAALLSKYVPVANSGGNGYIFNNITTATTDQYLGRVDFQPTTRDTITVVGIYQPSNQLNTLPFTGASVPGFGDGSISHTQQWTFDYVRQISSNIVNDLAAHYTRLNFDTGAPQQIVLPSSLGFGITPQDPASATVPDLSVSGLFTLGGTTNGPQPRIDQTIQFDDSLTVSLGSHQLKFGYDGRRFNVSNTFDNSNSGAYAFNTTQSTYSTGDAGLDFLLGIPATYSQGTGSVIQADAFLNYMYAQDQWKLGRNFTLNYGLGYSIDTPLRNHQYGGEAVSCFIVGEQSTVFSGAPKNLVYPGDPGCSNTGQAYTRYTELGPRIGFAWSPDLGWLSGEPGKFSIRGGFGIYYDRTEEESALQTLATPPFGFTTGGAADFGGSPSLANPYADINGGLTTGATGGPGAATEANRFPYVPPSKGQNVNFSGLEPIYNISSFAPSFRSPMAENFQLSVEREFPSRIISRLSYVGSLARHNQIDYEGNYETAAGHAACVASATCIADRNTQAYQFPGNKIGGSNLILEEGEVGSENSSSYHSLQVGLTKATTHGLEFQLSYTLSHALDSGSSFENSGFGTAGSRGYNQYNTALNYGNSGFDARHRLVFAPVYTTPLLHGKNFYNPLNLALSGWQVSGIITLATGQPYDISYAGTTSRSLYCDAQLSFYACPDVPLQVAPATLTGNIRARLATGVNSGHVQYITNASTAFLPEPIGTFGNTYRDEYHGPGINNTNLVVAKNFNLSNDGVIHLQVRLESDNVFNHTQFADPASQYGSSSFGTINGVQVASRLTQLAGKIYF